MRGAIAFIRRSIRLLGVWCTLRFMMAKSIGSRIAIGANVVIDAANSKAILFRTGTSDFDVLCQIFLDTEYDFEQWTPYFAEIRRQYSAIISSGSTPVIIDAGANVGFSAIWFARKFPNAKIISVEPNGENFDLMLKNVSDVLNIIPVRAALWDERVTVRERDDRAPFWARQYELADTSSGVTTITVPDLMQQIPNGVLLILKVDIEGAERYLLRSNVGWIDSIPLVIFEQHDSLHEWEGPWLGTGHAFFSALSRRKRDYLFRGENIFAFLHPSS